VDSRQAGPSAVSLGETLREEINEDVSGRGTRRDPYLIESVAHACDILNLFGPEVSSLGLKEVAARSGLNKTVAFRLLHTLRLYGLIQKSGTRYSSTVRLTGSCRFTVGYAEQTGDSPFSAAVTEGLRQAADRQGVRLRVLDNEYAAKTAIRNAEKLIRERVDLAIEFQTFESITPVISERFRQAGIPMIAVEIPHPGATYFGVDNYHMGVTAGRALARWAKQNWTGHVDQVLLLELLAAGAVPKLRLTGIIKGIQTVLPSLPEGCISHVDTQGDFVNAMQRVRRFIRSTPPRKVLIGGVNDPSVLGALRAFEEAGRLTDCAAMGLGAIGEARAEIRRKNGRLIGSVAFFPERYGNELMRLALNILGGKHTPPAVYTQHALITRDNVDHFYPNERPEFVTLENLVSRHGFR
jgi:ribose transport system substrate-binding protein